MKTRLIPLVVLVVAGVCLAADPHLGLWQLNEHKSTLQPGATKNTMVSYFPIGDRVRIRVYATGAAGRRTESEWLGKYDGQDYPVTGDPSSDTRAYKTVDDHTLEFTVKKSGKVTITGRIVVAADGLSRTVTATETDAAGNKLTNTAFYEKQVPPPGLVGGIPAGVLGGATSDVKTEAPPPPPARTDSAPDSRPRVSQGLMETNLIYKVNPIYPAAAKAARVSGPVTLRAVIGKDGKVQDVFVLSGPHLLLQSAVEAVKAWKYKPYTLNGEPVEVQTVITVNFSLAQ